MSYCSLRVTATLLLALVLLGCSEPGPIWGENYTVYNPVYRDNRVFYLDKPARGTTSQALRSPSDDGIPRSESIPKNSPLSIILRSVEIPSSDPLVIGDKSYKSPVSKSADYAVVLDVGVSNTGEEQSIVVWYQRGVKPGQSLNFSNLLVYYEPSWDERIAPLFRMRVIEVTKEKNEETRRMLDRANNLVKAAGVVSGNPNLMPVAGVAMAAASLIMANKENRSLLDFTVQLYSSKAISVGGSSDLGELRRGSYIVVGKPEEESRAFWSNATAFTYETQARILMNGRSVVNAPTALISIGPFESIIPKSVLERSAALNELLVASGKDSNIEQISLVSKQLNASVIALAWRERIVRYNERSDVELALGAIQVEGVKEFLSASEKHTLLRAVSKCFGSSTVMTEARAKAYSDSHPGEDCKED